MDDTPKKKEIEFKTKFGTHLTSLMITILLTKGLSIFSIKIFTNLLTQDEYGSYTFWITFILFCTGFSSSIFATSLWRYLEKSKSSEKQGERDQLISLSFLGSFTLLSIFFVFFLSGYLFFGFKLFPSDDYLVLLIVVLFVSFFSIIKEIILVISGAEQNSREIFLFNVTFHFLGLCIACIVAFIFPNHIYILLGLCVGYIITTLFIFLTKQHHYGFMKPKRKLIHTIIKFGTPKMVVRSINLLIPVVTLFMVGLFLGKTEVAVLSVGIQISTIFALIANGLTLAYRPYMTNSYEHGAFDTANKATTRIIELLIIAGIPLLSWLILLSPEIIILISSPEYSDSVLVIPFYLLATFLNSLSTFWLLRIDLKEKTSINAIIYFLSLLVLIILGYTLIPLFGLIGAGITLLAQSMVTLLFTTYFGNRNLKIDLNANFFMKIFFISGFCISLYITLFLPIDNRFISAILLSFLYIALVFGMRILKKEEIENIILLLTGH